MSLPQISYIFGDSPETVIRFRPDLPLAEYFGLSTLLPTPTTPGITWSLIDPSTSETIPGLIGGRLTDTFSRFSRSAKVALYDPDGTLAMQYPRSTPLQIWGAESGGASTLRFGGYVSAVSTADAETTLELLSFDAWLRGRAVYRQYSAGLTPTGILQDLVTTLTPLTWDASRVSLAKNDPLNARAWKGQKLDEVIGELLTGGEEFGATDTGVFFARLPNSSRSPRDFGEGEWSDADFDEDGKSEVNKVTIYWGSGESTGIVSVQDSASQLALQTALGASVPVVIEQTETYTEITSEAEARAKAQSILDDSEVIQTGSLKTWGGLAIRPGDVAHVAVEDQQVDGDFRVAAIEYNLGSDETTVTLAENSEGVVDVLVELSDKVSRIEAANADTDAALVEYIAAKETIEIIETVRIFTRSVPATMFTLGVNRGKIGAGSTIGDSRGAKTEVTE
jgi:hypothetical protein